MGWVVYLLRCGDGSLYAGATSDLARRLSQHQAGKGAAYTRSRLPVELAFFEPAVDRSAALRREAALKRLARADKWALVEAFGVLKARPSGRRSASGVRCRTVKGRILPHDE